ATAQTGTVVSASADCEKQFVFARVVDRRYDIGGVGAGYRHARGPEGAYPAPTTVVESHS
ncbi:hypothetical protein, partial [Paraburkholderia kirstenboschensis]|uniref:hypothetical protein n=1 Tax=Paraburkholderia kirstenboschensis TaxID=1245436 RepID=UPI001F21F914